ncbi:hypothetical protein F183_A45350 [Bryobacterales bacterium F-183]|nr:hypothetical protein F183_A45350 [Bryobacterales bacterium F-183]
MSPEKASVILEYVVANARREMKTTASVLAATPQASFDYKPADKYMDGGTLAWHIAVTEVFFLEGVATGSFTGKPPSQPADVVSGEQIAAWYVQEVTKVLDRCAALTPEEAAREVDFFGVFQNPACTFVTLATQHTIHHRGQLSAYLRPMGGKVPAIYGPSGDENPFAKG